MMKRWTALLLFLCCIAAGGAAAEEALKKVRTENGLFYIRADHRYVNNAGHFGVSRMKKGVQRLNAALDSLNGRVPVSMYLAESSRSHPIQRTFEEDSPAYLYLKENLHADRMDHLKYTTYDQFCEYFYATDHHWNYKGSYQGYQDVARLLLGSDALPLPPDGVVTLPVLFQGSFAKQEKNPISQEYFSFYRFDGLPPYETFINGKKAPYGGMEAYLQGVYGKGRYENHYSRLYGGDVAQVVLESERQTGGTLLMICNSFAHPIKPLLTFHFQRVVCIDLRYYRQQFHRDFSLNEAVDAFGADQVLLLGDVKMFIDADHIVP